MSFRDDYLRQRTLALSFLDPTWTGEGSRASAVDETLRTWSPSAPGLAALAAQNRRWATHPAQLTNLQQVLDGRAAVVVTGQQVGLYGGPLYTLHKAACAIRLAQQLSDESGTPVVPVFWLQSEDHDDAEIATATLLDAEADVTRVTMGGSLFGERRSVAHLTLDQGAPAGAEELEELLQGGPFAGAVAERAAGYWCGGARVVDAFAAQLSEWFGAHGLLMFELRDALAAPAAVELHTWAIRRAGDITQVLQQRERELVAAGYAAQIAVRPDCALSFWHAAGADGPRYRLQRAGGETWLVGGNERRSTSELANALNVDPLRASSSAMLRPLIQDSILPVVAWLGGPAEMLYAAQMAPLYELAGVRRPMILPRTHMRWHLQPWQGTLERSGLTLAELTGDVDRLSVLAGARSGLDWGAVQARVQESLFAALDAEVQQAGWVADEAAAISRRARGAAIRSARRLTDGLRRASLRRAETAQWMAARRFFAPTGVPQERILSPLAIAALMGSERMVERCVERCTPLVAETVEVHG